MTKLLYATTAIAALALASPASAEKWPSGISLGCTPIPVAGAKVDKNPSTRVNLDFALTDAEGREYQTPRLAVWHVLADGGHADRWGQYDFDHYSYFAPEGDGGANYIFTGSLKKNPKQIVGMSLWAPPANAVNKIWFYQEFIGRAHDPKVGGGPKANGALLRRGCSRALRRDHLNCGLPAHSITGRQSEVQFLMTKGERNDPTKTNTGRNRRIVVGDDAPCCSARRSSCSGYSS
jgi:hypothetical protein